MHPAIFDNWNAEPLAPASARLIDADLFFYRCLIEVIDAKQAGLPVTFRVPVHGEGNSR